MTVTLHTPTAHQFAAGHRDAAENTAASAAALRSDLGPLLPAFGVIGAEFLAALARFLDGSARRLDDLAGHHEAIAAGARTGVDAYQHTDATSAARTGAVQS